MSANQAIPEETERLFNQAQIALNVLEIEKILNDCEAFFRSFETPPDLPISISDTVFEILHYNDAKFSQALHITKFQFFMLLKISEIKGVFATSVGHEAAEKLVIGLFMLSNKISVSVGALIFKKAGSTISLYFANFREFIVGLEPFIVNRSLTNFGRNPLNDNIYGLSDAITKIYHIFRDYASFDGSIDGTVVSFGGRDVPGAAQKQRFMNYKKNELGINNMISIDSSGFVDMMGVGYAGSQNDTTIYKYFCIVDKFWSVVNQKLTFIDEKISKTRKLGDAGFQLDGYIITPYPSVRYHLDEYGWHIFQNPKAQKLKMKQVNEMKTRSERNDVNTDEIIGEIMSTEESENRNQDKNYDQEVEKLVEKLLERAPVDRFELYNQSHSRLRIAVEHYFGRFKNKFHMNLFKLDYGIEACNEIIKSGIILYNFYLLNEEQLFLVYLIIKNSISTPLPELVRQQQQQLQFEDLSDANVIREQYKTTYYTKEKRAESIEARIAVSLKLEESYLQEQLKPMLNDARSKLRIDEFVFQDWSIEKEGMEPRNDHTFIDILDKINYRIKREQFKTIKHVRAKLMKDMSMINPSGQQKDLKTLIEEELTQRGIPLSISDFSL